MAGHRKRRGDDHGEHPDERWLVTYADLMTLLVALFMVLFSISSVNISKFQGLQQSLQDAFSGKILPGGKSIKEAGGTSNIVSPSSAPPQSNLQPYLGGKPNESTKDGGQKSQVQDAQRAEEQQFRRLKAKLDAAARSQGLSTKIKTTITDEGLAIRLLTDDLLFDSGSATVRPQSLPILKQVAMLLGTEKGHQLIISGNTDTQPIHSAQFPDNLALSSARAQSIWRTFASDGLNPARMSATGRGEYRPIASNASAGGRSLNRRVEILVPRTVTADSSSGSTARIPSIKPDFASKGP